MLAFYYIKYLPFHEESFASQKKKNNHFLRLDIKTTKSIFLNKIVGIMQRAQIVCFCELSENSRPLYKFFCSCVITNRSYKRVCFIIQLLKRRIGVVILPSYQWLFSQRSPTDLCKFGVSVSQRKIMIIAIFKFSYLASLLSHTF